MTLTESSAFTMQRQTAMTSIRKPAWTFFYDELKLQLDALLHPDYTDEEIRREVRNFGISANPATHQLRLEEKGTVYNEMISSMNQPAWPLFRQIGIDTYGANHPLAYNNGGEPSGIRLLKPRIFVLFMPTTIPRQYGFDCFSAKGETWIPTRAHRCHPQRRSTQSGKLRRKRSPICRNPSPHRPEHQIVDFPLKMTSSRASLDWMARQPPTFRADALLLSVFLDSFAGDASTDLYRLFVNGATRKWISARTAFSPISVRTKVFRSPLASIMLPPPSERSKVKEIRALVARNWNCCCNCCGVARTRCFQRLVRSRLVDARRQLSS